MRRWVPSNLRLVTRIEKRATYLLLWPQTSHQNRGESGRRAVSGSRPSSVMSSVCSNCADRLPSAVVAVHASAQWCTCRVPSQIIGSIVKTCPTWLGLGRGLGVGKG